LNSREYDKAKLPERIKAVKCSEFI